MSDTVLIALVTGIAPTIAVIVSGFMTRKQVEEVHSIVNQQRTDMVNEIKRLQSEVESLHSAIGTAVTTAQAVLTESKPAEKKG